MARVVQSSLVPEALSRLRACKVHPLFAGYLHLLQLSSQTRTTDLLRPDFKHFYDVHLRVSDAPLGSPYVRPFLKEKPKPGNRWLNENVAGTYAPSSLRLEQPFCKVVTIDKQRKTYSLVGGHVSRALELLLSNTQISAVDIAVFFFRDYALPDLVQSPRDLGVFFINWLREPHAKPGADSEVGDLFTLDYPISWDRDWIEDVGHTSTDQLSNQALLARERIREMSAGEIFPASDEVAGSTPSRITSIAIRGLLGFNEECRFELGNLNILVGANGSGKTNLVSCLRLLRNTTGDLQAEFKESGFQNWLCTFGKGQHAAIIVSVYADGLGELEYTVRFKKGTFERASIEELLALVRAGDGREQVFSASVEAGQTLLKKVARGGRKKKVLSDEKHDPYQSVLRKDLDQEEYPELRAIRSLFHGVSLYGDWSMGRQSPLREAVSSAEDSRFLSEKLDNLAVVLRDMSKGGGLARVNEFLSQLNPMFQEVEIDSVGSKIRLLLRSVGSDKGVPAERLSDGTLRFLALASVLLHPKPAPIICIEEPELGLHPECVRLVAKMVSIAAKSTQVIITTHSELLLSYLGESFDVLFALRLERGGTVVRRFDKNELRMWQDEEDLGELWSSGALGGNVV